MNANTVQRKVTVTDPLGFHMRPLTAFAQLAGKFKSNVTVGREDRRVNGKSALELMLLGAEQGTELILEVSGEDSGEAIEALAVLLASPGVEDPPLPPEG